jgi:uncharacterized protein YndB with AHSA1/START domain
MTDSSAETTATHDTATGELVITRDFDAPRARLFRAFTDPDEIAEWFGPVGFTVPRESVELDPKPGGHQHFVMVKQDDPQVTSPVNARFLDVVENEALIGTEEFIGVPGVQEPTTMTLRIEFRDIGDDRTQLVIQQGPYAPAMELAARDGWDSSFTKLDALLRR